LNAMLRYQFLIRREQFWLPGALMGLFAAISVILGNHPYRVQSACALLAVVFPLVGGILAASAVVEDAALELQMAAPRPAWRTLLERSAVILGVIVVGGIVYQGWLAVLRIDTGIYGSLLDFQVVWLVPTVALIALAGLVAALTAQGTIAALVVGGVWLFEILARDWLASSAVGRRLLVFIGSFDPKAPDLWLSYACILALSAAMLVAAALLMRKSERYL
jgi:hypothetical protein